MRYKVNKVTGCWEWQGWVNENGYGRIEVAGKKLYAHRIYYHLLVEPVRPSDVIMHTCDNRKCVNPEHLTVGTHTDNHRDMVSKGRNAVGVNHGISKLDEDKARAIKLSRETDRVLAKRYGVSQDTISSCRRGKTWKHVVVEGVDID